MFAYYTIKGIVHRGLDPMKKVKANKVYSANGEIHFVLEEAFASAHSPKFKKFEKAEIKRLSREEALKPLALFREE